MTEAEIKTEAKEYTDNNLDIPLMQVMAAQAGYIAGRTKEEEATIILEDQILDQSKLIKVLLKERNELKAQLKTLRNSTVETVKELFRSHPGICVMSTEDGIKFLNALNLLKTPD